MAVAQILRPDGAVAGAGFLVAQGVVVTCAHVVEAAGGGPEAMVRLAFPHVDQAEGAERQGHVPGALWRATDHEDVAFIRLSSTPAGARPLPLGSAEGCRGHQVRSFGFPAQAPPDGHYGFGVAGDLLPGSEGRSAHLQLTAANDLTTGFSGGPVLDEVTGLVIGMLTEIAVPDQFERGQGVAYVTPTQALRQILPELAEQEVCPYRGLEPFTAEHARWFQGRQEAVRRVVTNLAQQRQLTLLFGPSGSGKSSLIQAGVLRALTEGELPGSDRWLPVLARPRQDLAAEIERAGLPAAITDGIKEAVTRRLEAEPTLQRILLIIDQFEELLTHAPNSHQQDRLTIADQITEAVDSHARLSVILIMRDDFYPQLAAQAPDLLAKAAQGILNIPGTLNQRDLHDIITLPAQDVGLHFQPGLPEQMVIDLLATTPEKASTQRAPVTVLPLLELTLSQLWLRRQNGYLTHEAYRRIGAISGSLTTWCDSALNDLTPAQRSIARRILTSLVHPADHSRRIPAVRAQRPLHELHELAVGPDAPDRDVDTVMAALTRHRIITTQTLQNPQHPDAPTGEPVAELIHDALIRDWGKLNEWVRQDHQFHDWLDRTHERQTRWAATGDPGDLLGGTALAEGLDWAEQRRLPGDISAFLAASKERQQAVIRRGKRINKILATLLAVVLLAVLGGGSALFLWQAAVTQRQAAVAQRQAERSQRLASRSDTLIEANPELASLLAIKAYQASHTPESIASLRTAASHPLITSLKGHVGTVDSVAFSPDGHMLATAGSDRAVRLWDIATGKAIGAPLTGHGGAVLSVAFSPDGQKLATAGGDRTVRLWDVATRKTQVIGPGHSDTVVSVAFSPDGHMLATAGSDRTVRLWDIATGKAIGAPLTGHYDAVVSVAFSPNRGTLVSASIDGTVRLWDISSGKTRAVLTGHTDAVESVAFSPDGHTLATASNDLTVLLWDATTGKFVGAPLIGHAAPVQSVAFSPDGQTVATGSADRTVRLWDVASGRPSATFVGHTGAVWSVAFSPDGRRLATASDDRSVRLWDVALPEPAVAIEGICRTVERDITPYERTAYLRYLPDHTWPACPPTS